MADLRKARRLVSHWRRESKHLNQLADIFGPLHEWSATYRQQARWYEARADELVAALPAPAKEGE